MFLHQKKNQVCVNLTLTSHILSFCYNLLKFLPITWHIAFIYFPIHINFHRKLSHQFFKTISKLEQKPLFIENHYHFSQRFSSMTWVGSKDVYILRKQSIIHVIMVPFTLNPCNFLEKGLNWPENVKLTDFFVFISIKKLPKYYLFTRLEQYVSKNTVNFSIPSIFTAFKNRQIE